MRSNLRQTTLGRPARVGPCLLTQDEDTRGHDGIAIGYGLWRDFFGDHRGVLGSTARANGVPLTVIGVAPCGFDNPGRTSLCSAGFDELPQAYGVRDSASSRA